MIDDFRDEDFRNTTERAATHAHHARVQEVLDRAVENGASLLVAMVLHGPGDVTEMWVDRLWNDLRDSLSDDRRISGGIVVEDRLKAIVLLLDQRIKERATALLDSTADGDAW